MAMCDSAEARGYVLLGFNNTLINAFFCAVNVFASSGLLRVQLADFATPRLRPPESTLP
jgi:hypothetical protein